MYRKLPRAQRPPGEGPGLGCGEVSRPPAQSGERKKSPGLGCGKAAPRHRRAKDDSPGTTTKTRSTQQHCTTRTTDQRLHFFEHVFVLWTREARAALLGFENGPTPAKTGTNGPDAPLTPVCSLREAFECDNKCC